MAPTTSKSSSKGKAAPSSKGGKSSKFSSSSSGFKVSKSSSSKAKGGKRPPPKEVKGQSRSAPDRQKKTKTREYTEKELDLPALNMITPVGVQTPRGKKKGKTFVDDQVSLVYFLFPKTFYLRKVSNNSTGEYDDHSRNRQC